MSLTFVSIRKLCRHQCGLPVAAIDHRNPAVLCISKITMLKITVSTAMTTILAERTTIGITEMSDTHTSDAILKTAYWISSFQKNTSWTLPIAQAMSTDKFTIQSIWLMEVDTIWRSIWPEKCVTSHVGYTPKISSNLKPQTSNLIYQDKSHMDNRCKSTCHLWLQIQELDILAMP